MVNTAASQGLRIVFFGTPGFAVPTIERLLESRHRVVGVVTQPDRPSGRGQRITDGPVKRVALQHGLPLFQPTALRTTDFLSALASLAPDLGVVAAYGRILPETALGIPRLGMINVHASLLPKYRGAAPVHRAVIAGEPETGVTIMRLVKEMDAGPMLGTTRRTIDPNETSDVVERDLAILGAERLMQALEELGSGRAVEVAQDHAQATYAPRLTREDGIIDWSKPALEIHNLVRGLHPWPHAFTFLGDQRLLVLQTALDSDPLDPAAMAPGTLVEASGGRLAVATGSGALRLVSLQLEGRRPVTTREFLAGHKLHAGSKMSAGSSP